MEHDVFGLRTSRRIRVSDKRRENGALQKYWMQSQVRFRTKNALFLTQSSWLRWSPSRHEPVHSVPCPPAQYSASVQCARVARVLDQCFTTVPRSSSLHSSTSSRTLSPNPNPRARQPSPRRVFMPASPTSLSPLLPSVWLPSSASSNSCVGFAIFVHISFEPCCTSDLPKLM